MATSSERKHLPMLFRRSNSRAITGDDQVRVLLITRKWKPAIGGMETYSVRLSEELSDHVQIRVIALHGRADGSPPSMTSLLSFPFVVLFSWLLRTKRPEIIHIGDMAIWPFSLLGWLSSKHPKIILSAHGTDVSYHRRGGIRGSLYGLYLRLGASILRSSTVIANSNATAKVLKETGWQNSVVIPLATDLNRDRETDGHKGRLLFAGRLMKLKGLSWFVENVLPLLPQKIELDVAGTIWDEHEAKALDDPRVTFLGPLNQPDLTEAYQKALCVVVPNISVISGEYEGFGLVAPEAASSGGVVIAARCDGLVDAVIDGETGFLVQQGNEALWASKILEIASWSDASRTEFTRLAQDTAKEIYSWPRVADETVEVYRRVIT